MTKKPIRMIPDTSEHHLDDASRINYAKVYTVEHNVKVYFIGKISRKYEQQVTTDYNSTHRPLPDRPYDGDMTDEDFGHAEGPDPQYPARPSLLPAPKSWSGQGAALSQTQDLNANFPSTTTTSSYGMPATSTWSTSPTMQASSLYSPQASYIPPSTSADRYTVPYNPTSMYENPSTASTYHPQLGEGEGAGLVAEETTAVEGQYDPLYDVSD
jgi:hypothetical protein